MHKKQFAERTIAQNSARMGAGSIFNDDLYRAINANAVAFDAQMKSSWSDEAQFTQRSRLIESRRIFDFLHILKSQTRANNADRILKSHIFDSNLKRISEFKRVEWIHLP